MTLRKFLVLTAGTLAVSLLSVSTAYADGSDAEDTGDEFAPEQVDPDPAKLSQSQAESRIRAAGISVYSSGGCTNRNKSNCTSFEQINDSTVSGIITLKSASGCAITITGGTETGHASGTYSHWNGYKVDISITSCISSYITRNFTYQGKRGDGAPLYKSAAGNLYANEGSHWDITYF
ncbi:MAG: hypothetical protein U1A78_06805 [Polyangia bacterium]